MNRSDRICGEHVITIQAAITRIIVLHEENSYYISNHVVNKLNKYIRQLL